MTLKQSTRRYTAFLRTAISRPSNNLSPTLSFVHGDVSSFGGGVIHHDCSHSLTCLCIINGFYMLYQHFWHPNFMLNNVSTSFFTNNQIRNLRFFFFFKDSRLY